MDIAYLLVGLPTGVCSLDIRRDDDGTEGFRDYGRRKALGVDVR